MKNKELYAKELKDALLSGEVIKREGVMEIREKQKLVPDLYLSIGLLFGMVLLPTVYIVIYAVIAAGISFYGHNLCKKKKLIPAEKPILFEALKNLNAIGNDYCKDLVSKAVAITKVRDILEIELEFILNEVDIQMHTFREVCIAASGKHVDEGIKELENSVTQVN